MIFWVHLVTVLHSHNNDYLVPLRKRQLFVEKLNKKNLDKIATDLFACSDDAGRFMFGDSSFKVVKNAVEVVHPFAYVSPKAKLSEGCVVLPYAIINTECHIAEACIVNCGAIIDHGCILEKGVHVAPGGIVKAENRIPAYMKVDSGEVIQNRSYQP